MASADKASTNKTQHTPEESATPGTTLDTTGRFTKEQYGAVDSFQAAMELVAATYGGLIAAHEQELLGDGFKVASEEDKLRLVGVPLLLMDWTIRPSDFGKEEWVNIHAIQRGDDGEAVKWIISDGGTGIARDLKAFTAATGRDGGMTVKNGLRVSKYYIDAETKVALSKSQVREYMIANKAMSPAATFYLDTSA